MTNFTTNLGRKLSKLKGIYKPKYRSTRPPKPQSLRNEIEHAQIAAATLSPASGYTTVTAADGTTDLVLDSRVASPTEPVSVDLEATSQDKAMHGTTNSPGRVDGLETFVSSPSGVERSPTEGMLTETAGPVALVEHIETVAEEDYSGPLEIEQQYGKFEAEYVEAQTIREQAYIWIHPEEPEDYTDGPPRMVLAADGIKQCPALLMTFDLSAKLQRALRAQRDFAKAQDRHFSQVQVIMNYERALKRQIASCRTRLGLLDEVGNRAADGCATLNEELDTLTDLLQDAKNRRQAAQSTLETKGDLLREIQAEANAYLEDAFVCARMLESDHDEPETPLEPIDIQQEYQEFRQARQIEQGETPEVVAPLETGIQHLMAAPLDPEQQAVADMKNSYWAAERRLNEATVAFDRREYDRALEWQANYDAVERGEDVEDTPEEFDLRWHKQYQELTREVIEAETALAEAKAAALAAGIEVGTDDQASGFVDDVADGYRMSLEQELIASVPEPKVCSWLDNVPDQASPTLNDDVEVDEWDTQTVGISDSVSLVAEGPDRGRIEKWRRICGL